MVILDVVDIRVLKYRDEPLKGVESQRLRTYFTSSTMEPREDLDVFGYHVIHGDLSYVKEDFNDRVKRLGADEAVAEINRLRYGATKTPIYNVLLLGSIIQPALHKKQLEVVRWLALTAGVPVDGRDVSGTTALVHSLATHPSFDPEFAEILCAAGGDINARDRYGGTCGHGSATIWNPCDRALIRKKEATLRWWLEHGGNADIHDNDGISVRSLALTSERRGMSKELIRIVREEDARREQLIGKICGFCAKEQSVDGGKLLACGRCKKVKYCAPPRACQKSDWKKHKITCKAQ